MGTTEQTTFDARNYWETRLAQASGLEGVGYIGLGQAFNEWMYRVRAVVFKRVVRPLLPKDAKVLDVGSGTGVYLRLWQNLGAARISGSDITDTAVGRLKEQRDLKGIDLFRMDISAGDARLDGSYDMASCMDVLFHIVDDAKLAKALRNFHQALKPGGTLIISDNFLHHQEGSEKHFVVRSLAQYEAALRSAGFEPMVRRPMFHLLNRPMDSRSSLLWRWWALVERTCRASYTVGGILAMVVFPIELLAVGLRKEGVSTEIMVCRRSV